LLFPAITHKIVQVSIFKRLASLLGLIILAVSLVGCTPSNRCSNDGDCAAGFSCAEGICRQQKDGSNGTDDGDGGAGDSDRPQDDMVTVDAGTFHMGCDENVEAPCAADEVPYHDINLAAFEIDRHEVSQANYQACVRSGTCFPPASDPECHWDPVQNADLPVVCVNWEQARTYCGWLNNRLPSEAEWEKAARGLDARIFPWGNADPDCSRAASSECVISVQPVGSLPAGVSPCGALDMGGNVWEWVNDYYLADYYASSPANNPPGPADSTHRAMRGGSYLHEAALTRCANRGGEVPTVYKEYLGFRCAR